MDGPDPPSQDEVAELAAAWLRREQTRARLLAIEIGKLIQTAVQGGQNDTRTAPPPGRGKVPASEMFRDMGVKIEGL